MALTFATPCKCDYFVHVSNSGRDKIFFSTRAYHELENIWWPPSIVRLQWTMHAYLQVGRGMPVRRAIKLSVADVLRGLQYGVSHSVVPPGPGHYLPPPPPHIWASPCCHRGEGGVTAPSRCDVICCHATSEALYDGHDASKSNQHHDNGGEIYVPYPLQ